MDEYAKGYQAAQGLNNQYNPVPASDTLKPCQGFGTGGLCAPTVPTPRAVAVIIGEIEETEREIAKFKPIHDLYMASERKTYRLVEELHRALRERALATK